MGHFEGWEHLFQGIDNGAFHNSVHRKDSSQSRSRQYEEVRRRAMHWAKDTQVAERVLWLHGSCASAISQNIANFQQEDHGLLATYFINKCPHNLNARARFIPTITYQLGNSFRPARKEIANIITHDRTILSRSVAHQLQTLILHPLAPFLSVPDDVTGTEHHPVLIIVDGCDYLDNYTQNCVIDALLRISQEFLLRVRVLLSTESSAMIPSLTQSIVDGLVTEIAFSDGRFLWANIKGIWNKLRNVARINRQR